MNDLLQRRGIIKIKEELIMKNPDEALEILSDILIVRMDNDFMTRTLTYSGYSKKFDFLYDDEVPPEYVAEVDSITKEVKYHRQKQYTEKNVKNMLEDIKNEINKNTISNS